MINKFIHSSFKVKDKADIDINYISKVSKIIGIDFPKSQLTNLDRNFFLSWEFLCTAKERLLRYFYNTINRSNNLVPNVDVTEAGCKSLAKSKIKEDKKKMNDD